MIEYTELTDADVGEWELTTDVAIYRINLDSRTGSRKPLDAADSLSLERDEEHFRLIRLVRCALGAPMVLVLERMPPGSLLSRQITTHLNAIRPVSFG